MSGTPIRRAVWACLLAACLGAACSTSDEQRSTASNVSATSTERDAGSATPTSGASTELAACAVDVHLHLDGIHRDGPQWQHDFASAAAQADPELDRAGVATAIVMPPPISADEQQLGTYEIDTVIEELGSSDGLAFGGGGGTLDPVIHGTPAGDVPADVEAEFRSEAQRLADLPIVAFGELAALHLSFRSGHPFLAVPPDHPLLLVLADVAAANDLPIDLHMETVVETMPLPDGFASPPNPAQLEENIAGFERLLEHNADARIVWAHVGWDNTGDLTPSLVSELMARHPNLYASLKVAPQQAGGANALVEDGAISDEWLAVIEKFADRFVIGADEFLGIEGVTPPRPPSLVATWEFVDQLPPDLARQLACDNPRKIYRFE